LHHGVVALTVAALLGGLEELPQPDGLAHPQSMPVHIYDCRMIWARKLADRMRTLPFSNPLY
jgi:hypothetical protein